MAVRKSSAPEVIPMTSQQTESRPAAPDDVGTGQAPAGARARPVVEVHNVDKIYANGTVALKDVDCTIRSGEFVSLLGPSGCGKSTLLRIMAGLGGITAGSVKWWEQDFDVVGTPGHRLTFVFQDATLMPWARVRQNVRLPLDLAGEGKTEEAARRIDEALAMVGLQNFGNAFPRELSGGMQMRASIARAMVTQPNFLLMDEPFGALDEMTRNRLNDDVLRLWKEKRWTVAFVTHSVYEAVYLSTRIEVMAARPGRVTEEITIDERYPRDQEFRKSDRFAHYCRRVSEALERASAMGDDSEMEV